MKKKNPPFKEILEGQKKNKLNKWSKNLCLLWKNLYCK